MGPMQTMVFSLLFLASCSLAKVCPGCQVNGDTSNPAAYEYLSETLKSLRTTVPKGLDHGIQAEIVRILNVKKQVSNEITIINDIGNVKSGQKKVVAGISYSYDFEARDLNTKKLYDCNLQVLRQSWENRNKVIQYSCYEVSASNNERSLFGGEVNLVVDHNNKLEGLKTFLGQEIPKELGSKYLMAVTKYFKASLQIVDGILIRATVEVAKTNCSLDRASHAPNCDYQTENHQVCDVQVLLKPWIDVKELTQIQCRPQPEYCPGCLIKTNSNDVELQKCLERTLSNLNAGSHSSQKISLVKINEATFQIIAGVKYTVDFDGKDEDSGKLLECNAVIISQPWISEEPQLAHFNCAPRT